MMRVFARHFLGTEPRRTIISFHTRVLVHAHLRAFSTDSAGNPPVWQPSIVIAALLVKNPTMPVVEAVLRVTYPRVQQKLKEQKNEDVVCMFCAIVFSIACCFIFLSLFLRGIQKLVIERVMRLRPMPLPMRTPDVIVSRSSLNFALAKAVLQRQLTVLRGPSASGKTVSVHCFMRTALRTASPDDDCIFTSTRKHPIQIPIACHLQLRQCPSVADCVRRLRSAMGLRTSL